MKTVLEKSTRDELIGRINQLGPNSAPQWGKMNVYQMLKHCTLADEMFLGKKSYPRVFIGRIFGRIALKSMLKDEKPIGKNAPTGTDFMIKESDGDISVQKEKWLACIAEYEHLSNPGFAHWFFGKMTEGQIGQFAYKHIDHHLRQFGC